MSHTLFHFPYIIIRKDDGTPAWRTRLDRTAGLPP